MLPVSKHAVHVPNGIPTVTSLISTPLYAHTFYPTFHPFDETLPRPYNSTQPGKRRAPQRKKRDDDHKFLRALDMPGDLVQSGI